MKKIDAHAHICEYINGIGGRGELRALGKGYAEYADGKKFQIFPEYMGDTGVSPESLLKIMNKYDVEKAVLLQGNYLGFQNLYVADAIRKYPNRFTGACTIDPFFRNRDSIVKHLMEDLGFKIIKMEVSNTSGLMANHDDVDLFGEKMRYVYDVARKYNATFVIDIGRPGNPCHQPARLREAMLNYSDVTFVVCHLGSYLVGREDLFKENISMLNLPNVYFDLASVANNSNEDYPFPIARGFLRIAKEIVGAKRLMFGSDMPTALSKHSYQEFIDFIEKSDIFTDKELEDIFYNTANKVYFK